MSVSDEKINKNTTVEKNTELAGLLTGKWINKEVVAIVKDKRQGGEYWVLVNGT